jgi:hypothetical protein
MLCPAVIFNNFISATTHLFSFATVSVPTLHCDEKVMEGRVFSTALVFRFLEQDLFQGLIFKVFVCFKQNLWLQRKLPFWMTGDGSWSWPWLKLVKLPILLVVGLLLAPFEGTIREESPRFPSPTEDRNRPSVRSVVGFWANDDVQVQHFPHDYYSLHLIQNVTSLFNRRIKMQ